MPTQNNHWGGNQVTVPRKRYAQILSRLQGRGLDPEVVQAFKEIFDDITIAQSANIDVIERNINRIPPFTFSGALAASISPPWYHHKSGLITRFHCALRVAGSTTTTVVLRLNGAAVTGASVSLASSVKTGFVDLSTKIKAIDEITCEITAAGTGAEDLTCRISNR